MEIGENITKYMNDFEILVEMGSSLEEFATTYSISKKDLRKWIFQEYGMSFQEVKKKLIKKILYILLSLLHENANSGNKQAQAFFIEYKGVTNGKKKN